MTTTDPHTSTAPRILFVLGVARSGTTYLTDVLDDHFDFGMSPEGHFVLEFANKISRYGDLAVSSNLNRLLEDIRAASTLRIIREEWPPERRFDVSVEELAAHVVEPTYASVVYAVFECIASHLGKPHVGTKNPAYTTNLPMLESLFPGDAKYVHVVRDGRDVALSLMRMPWGEKTAYACAKVWNRYMNLAAEFEERVGSERFLNVRYEDLVSNPRPTLERLEAFLGIEVKRGDEFLARAAQSTHSTNFGKWATRMSEAEVARFEALAGANLEKWGYESGCADPSIGLLERGYFEAADVARRVAATCRERLGSILPG